MPTFVLDLKIVRWDAHGRTAHEIPTPHETVAVSLA